MEQEPQAGHSLDIIDAKLWEARQRLIWIMFEQGKLDAESASALLVAHDTRQMVDEDRTAFDQSHQFRYGSHAD